MSKIANEPLEIHVQHVKQALYNQYVSSTSPEDKLAMNCAISAINELIKELEMRVLQVQLMIRN